MKKLNIIILALIMCQTVFSQSEDEDFKVDKQLWKNAHINWATFKTHDYKWTDLGLGTAMGDNFPFEERLSWKAGLDINWNKYTLYDTGNFSYIDQQSKITMWSLSVPVTVNYEVYKDFMTGINLYTGPVYEQILTVSSKQIESSQISHAQFGWTFGTRVRFFSIISVRISYVHYFTGLFTNDDFNRSAIRFSLGF